MYSADTQNDHSGDFVGVKVAGLSMNDKLFDLQQRVSRLEGHQSGQATDGKPMVRATVVSAVLAVVVAGVVAWGAYITANVIAIKQQLADGGNKAIVASLEKPRSADILRADLATVIAQVETARAQGVKSKPEKTVPLSRAISHILKSGDAPDVAWQAASALVNYRGIATHSLPACIIAPYTDSTVDDPPNNDGVIDTVDLLNCTLTIDDPMLFRDAVEYRKDYRERHAIGVDHIFIVYRLQGVHIVYGGGAIHATTIYLKDCTFEIRLKSPPHSSGKQVVENLLEANDLDYVEISLPPPPVAQALNRTIGSISAGF